MPTARTLEYCVTKVKQKFGKSNADLETNIEDFVKDRLRELCSDFDYWFLRINPGFTFPASFPYSSLPSPVQDRWLDQGWLLTQEDVEYYKVKTSNVTAPGGSLSWADAEVARLGFIKRYDKEGSFQADIAITDQNNYWSSHSFMSTTGTGYPRMATLHTTEGVSYIRLNPIPDDAYPLAVSFLLAHPPFYVDGSSTSSLLLRYYPRAVMALVGLEYAEWFHEPKMEDYYRRQLFGDTDDGRVRSELNSGLVGKMKRDTIKRDMADTEELPYLKSVSDAIGRDGAYGRNPGDSFYTGPLPY